MYIVKKNELVSDGLLDFMLQKTLENPGAGSLCLCRKAFVAILLLKYPSCYNVSRMKGTNWWTLKRCEVKKGFNVWVRQPVATFSTGS